MSQSSESPLVDTEKDISTSRPSDAGTGARTLVSKRKPHNPTEQRNAFRQRVGIPEKNEIPEHTFRETIERAYHRQSRYYWIVASASHGMLWLQIGIGATLTAIGSTNSNTARIAIVVLGAINTVVAGLLTFLKSRNQPNRALQFRNGLRGVYEDLWQVDSETCREDFDIDQKMEYLWGKYKEAVSESEANYPDLWVSLNKVNKSSDLDKHPSSQLKQSETANADQPTFKTRP